MLIKDILSLGNPEPKILDIKSDLLYHPILGRYLPLKKPYLSPLPFNLSRPGKDIIMHVICEYPAKNPFDENFKSVKEEGFVGPKNYTSFFTLPMEWSISRRAVYLVCRTHSRWSREYSDGSYTSFREPLIGIDVITAEGICPNGLKYVRAKSTSQPLDVLSYIPPQHFLGIIKPSSKVNPTFFERLLLRLSEQFEIGVISEDNLAEEIYRLLLSLEVEGKDGMLINEEQRIELSLSMGGMISEAKIMSIISKTGFKIREGNHSVLRQLRKEKANAENSLRNMIVTSPFCRNLQKQALDYLT